MKVNKLFNVKTLESQIKDSFEIISRYYQNLENILIQPSVIPGFLKTKISTDIPNEPTEYKEVLSDLEKHYFPNLVHWNHPSFFGYFPSPISHSAIAAEMICTAIGTPNFNWNVSPASHEIEWIVSDWMCQILNLPEKFQFHNKGGGGVVNSVTEGLFLSVNKAKFKKVQELNLDIYDHRRLKFVAYYPESNKSWAQKALHLKDIHTQRILAVQKDHDIGSYKINAKELENKIRQDLDSGLIPFWYGSQIGSTDCGVFDNLEEIGPILKRNKIYLNVDAAYSGMFWSCPEFRVNGLNYANSISINMGKTGLTGIIGAMMFTDDKELLVKSVGNIDSVIYRNEFENGRIDYKDFTVGFGRRMSALKIYILLKTIGVKGYQEYLRSIIDRGHLFEKLIIDDSRFELFCKPVLGLVCFMLKATENDIESYNDINLKLYDALKKDTHDGFITSSILNGRRFLRFVSGNPLTEDCHIKKFWRKLSHTADLILEKNK